MEPVDVIALVLVLAAAVGSFNHLCVGLPRSIGVLLGSLALSLLAIAADRLAGVPLLQAYHETMDRANLPRFFLDGALALLLFAGSLHVDARELNRRKWMILALSTSTVMLSTVIFGAGILVAFRLAGAHIRPAWCFMIGAILAPTDAVVVASLLNRAPLSQRLRATITGESLFNDGAALVLYIAMLGVTRGRLLHIGHGQFVIGLSLAIAGGAVIGGLSGAAASWLIRRVHDEGLQLLISLALVVGCFRVADTAGVSAPIAVVTAGLCMKLLTPDFSAGAGCYATLVGFWSLLDQLLDTLLFLLIGFELLELTLAGSLLAPILIAIPLALVARFVSVAVPVGLSRGGTRDKLRDTATLTWAGLRGGISVALALTLPESAYRAPLLGVCYVVVLFTIVVQGLSMGWVLRALYGGAGKFRTPS